VKEELWEAGKNRESRFQKLRASTAFCLLAGKRCWYLARIAGV
jgi:hypothetical protein